MWAYVGMGINTVDER
ncbi:hypothetical protein CGLO_06960 [Colletotrichum gloeosporioides Cg-14]|uniref:Uncharacterized protein n=1 Tax=Colletotrichum gloeosporioides (strain Cg-14) TaxID=1237896 RepID=T0LXY0_COLGC|nr:hypothetical protein CGLO_06960 [Colletotrichum gloeosporioides Cg-14]